MDPAVIDLPNDPSIELYIMGDIHGDFKPLRSTLEHLGLIQVHHWNDSERKISWTGGRKVLVFVGDLIDKGNHSLDVLDLIEEMELRASAAGGRVIALAGNHEIGFLADPKRSKAKEFRDEIAKRNLNVCDDVFSSASRRGQWLRRRPAALFVNGVFINHSGWAAGQDRSSIERLFRDAATDSENGLARWDTPFTCGDHKANPPTPGYFNAEVWWGKNGGKYDQQRKLLGVKQIIFGHDPGAFDQKGKLSGYFGKKGGGLFKLDIEMSAGGFDPAIFVCRDWATGGGCDKPKVFILRNNQSNPNDIEDFDLKKGDAPEQKQPSARDEC